MENDQYYLLVDPCYNIKISNILDCAQCVNHGCRLYQDLICADFNSDAVQNWEQESLFSTHPDEKFCPAESKQELCMGHSKADEDSRSIKIFHAKPSFVGFQCAFKVDSKSKDFKIKLKRGKNELKTAYN